MRVQVDFLAQADRLVAHGEALEAELWRSLARTAAP